MAVAQLEYPEARNILAPPHPVNKTAKFEVTNRCEKAKVEHFL